MNGGHECRPLDTSSPDTLTKCPGTKCPGDEVSVFHISYLVGGIYLFMFIILELFIIIVVTNIEIWYVIIRNYKFIKLVLK